jgi:hypothetical protein
MAWAMSWSPANRCHDELRQTMFFEPPHHSGHQPLDGWVTGPAPGHDHVTQNDGNH